MKKNKPYGDDYVPANDEADMTDVLEEDNKEDDDEEDADEDEDLGLEEDDDEEEELE